jgi:hypothetical protein
MLFLHARARTRANASTEPKIGAGRDPFQGPQRACPCGGTRAPPAAPAAPTQATRPGAPRIPASILPPFSDNDSTSFFMRIGDLNPGLAAPDIDDLRAIRR